MFSLGRRATAAVTMVVVVILGVSLAPTIEARLGGGIGFDRPVDASAEPLALPPQVQTTGPHEFLREVDGEPVRYDPCAPIHVVVNPRTAIEGADEMLQQALDSVTAATGLTFVQDGVTDEAPSDQRGSVPGSQDPVLIAWSDPDEVEALEGSVAGIGGSVSTRGSPWFDTGAVTLDGPQLADVLRRPGGWVSARGVVLHELGHLVGLGHVDAEDELMAPRGRPGIDDWGPGDREGLAALGGDACREY
ncbi:hypothetical protein [Aeromicrobium sp. CF3.5]|uniref:hypothetical protein n=1 Tax=Aeromicrobium sp. CF3.5 TaxID=3373078 RepID=UPI003EE7F5D7